jgi:hypothetical protein
MNKKQFALKAILPYFLDSTICGYSEEADSCMYLTSTGNMCVAGKYMIIPSKWSGIICNILNGRSQEEVFRPEVVGILTNNEWDYLQAIHDYIAVKNDLGKLQSVKELNLFTWEELQEAIQLAKQSVIVT